MKTQVTDLNKFGLVPMQPDELRENSGGFLILIAIALELGAAAIEVGSLALAADMIVNPSRYTDAYKRGLSGH